MGFNRWTPQRAKRPRSYVEGDRVDLDPLLLQPTEQGPREMEARCRSCHGALMLGIDCLIAPPIAQGSVAGRDVVFTAPDIGWERNPPNPLQPRAKVAPAAKFDPSCP
jgi:hypothetical protein